MTQRVYNFAAGPATLPLSVLEQVRRDLPVLPGAGASVLEISHRSAAFDEILTEAEANLRALLALPPTHRVLFLPGGASLQFSMVPLNFLRDAGRVAEYVLSGAWSNKALQEARKEGQVRVVWDGKAEGYTRAPRPEELELNPAAAYVHFTSNETIQGVQFPAEPPAVAPLICDMSSDFLSRPLAVEKYALIYAGAQKNAGPAGVTLVIVREDLLERAPAGLPSMLDYRVHVKKRSAYNTPPVFAIYAVMLVSRWLLREVGGLARVEEINREKARLLYQALDDSDGFYRPHARPDSRSLMNVTWRLADEALEAELLRGAAARGLSGLRGHRSVGGLRASLYNAMPLEGVRALCDCLREFQRQHA